MDGVGVGIVHVRGLADEVGTGEGESAVTNVGDVVHANPSRVAVGRVQDVPGLSAGSGGLVEAGVAVVAVEAALVGGIQVAGATRQVERFLEEVPDVAALR